MNGGESTGEETLAELYKEFMAATPQTQQQVLAQTLEFSRTVEGEQSKRFWMKIHDWLKSEANKL